MKSAVTALPIALAVAVCLTPIARLLAFRWGAVSHPGGRNVHASSTPRLGGLAIAVAFFAPLLGLALFDAALDNDLAQQARRLVGLAVGGVVMCLVGAIDDTRGIRAVHKLYAQIAVACLAFACGFRIDAVHTPFGDLSMGIFALPVTILWIVGVVNAVNLIDGLDGLAAGVVFFAAVTNFIVAYLNGAVVVALLSASTAGAVLGFLFYNFNPARIFMGDSGSYFLGYVLAVTSLLSQKASTAVSLLVPIVALGVPIIDTLFAMVRRILERRPVFSPDRGHIHHRLLDMGITHRRAVIIIYGVCVLFTVLALAISIGRSWEVGAAILGASAVMIGLVRFVGYFELSMLRRRQKARLRSRDAELMRMTLPKVPQLFERARDEAELFEALSAFAREADLGYVEAIEGDRVAFRWSNGQEGAVRNMVSASYPIGRDDVARATLKFGWISDWDDVSPQSEILLQVVTDVLERHLTRLHSEIAPRRAETEPARPSFEALATGEQAPVPRAG